MATSLQCGRFKLDLGRPLVMGILNATPDSFSDGQGQISRDQLLERAHQMMHDGVDILDIGGESTRPGSNPVPISEELDRVLPLIEALHPLRIPLSVDTCKPEVMSAALAAGADMINDIKGFREPGAIEAVVQGASGLCIMHMQGEPRTMQLAPHYDDVVHDVAAFLAERVARLQQAGVAKQRLLLDPGFGFGKTVGQNFSMLRRLQEMRSDRQLCDLPWLAGLSRKSMLGAVVGKEPAQRVAASVAAALFAVEQGVHILRVHDVAETVDALKIWCTIKDESFT